jgi:hypothetical protein
MIKNSMIKNYNESKNLKSSKIINFQNDDFKKTLFTKNSFYNLDKETSYDEKIVIYDNLKYECMTIENILEEKIKQSKELNISNIKMKSDIFLLEKEQEILQYELNIIEENIKDCNWRINKDLCNKFLSSEKYDKPNNYIIFISETFLFTFRIKDTSWNSFLDLLRNFTKLKNLMSNFSGNNLEDKEINKLMDLWKSKENFVNALIEKFPEICLILNWLILLLESIIKTNSLNNSREKNKQLNSQIININNKLKDINSEIISLKLNIKKFNLLIENSGEKIKSLESKTENLQIEHQNKKGENNINQVTLMLNTIDNNKIQNSIIKTKLNRKSFRGGSQHRKNDSTLDGNTPSYEMDEKYAVIKNPFFKKPNQISKDEDDILILNTIKEIKLDMKSYSGAKKPLPSQQNKATAIKQQNFEKIKKKFINEFPIFKTKNNQKVLNKPELEDKINLHNLSNFQLERFSINNKSDNEKIMIPLSGRLSMEDETSEFSKNLKFSPNNSIFKPSLMSQIEPVMLDFNTSYKNQNKFQKNDGNSCSKNFKNIFC